LCDETPAEATVDADGCSIDDPAEQPIPDADEDGVSDDDDFCPETQSGSVVDEFGCPVEESPDVTQPRCGACGAFGMISWFALLIGFAGLKSLPLLSRRRRA